MIKSFFKHSGYYLVLVGLLLLSFLLVLTNSGNRNLQMGVIVATTFFYFLWGIIHHMIDHDLNMKIVLEYILIGVFGLTIIFSLLMLSGN